MRTVEDAVHGGRTVVENRPDLLAIDELGDRGSAVPDEPGDLLDGYPAVGQQGDEAVSQLAGHLIFGGEPGRVPDPSEAASHVRRVQGCAGLGGEDEVVVLPAVSGEASRRCLAGLVCT